MYMAAQLPILLCAMQGLFYAAGAMLSFSIFARLEDRPRVGGLRGACTWGRALGVCTAGHEDNHSATQPLKCASVPHKYLVHFTLL